MKTVTYTIKIPQEFIADNVQCEKKIEYFFKKQGYTAVFILNQDSYATIHTWPEHGYARGTFYGLEEDYKNFRRQINAESLDIPKIEKQSTLRLKREEIDSVRITDIVNALSKASMLIVQHKEYKDLSIFILAESHFIIDTKNNCIHCYTCGMSDSSEPLMNLIHSKGFEDYDLDNNYFYLKND